MTLLSNPLKRRWLAFGALATVFLLVNLHRLSTGVLSEELASDFGTSAAQLGTLHASFFYIYALIQIPTGVLVDRIGPREIGAGGAAVLSLGAVGFALSDSYLPALVSRMIIGMGSGVIFVSILRFSANWFRADEFATMTGLTGACAGLGGILATTPLAVAVTNIGWRPSVFGLAAIGLAAAVAVYVLARSSPADAGLEPIEGVPEQPSVTLRETGAFLRRILRDPTAWLLSIIFFCVMGTLLTLIGLWGVPYLVQVYGLDVTTASYYTLLGSFGLLIGSPAIGWLSDTLGSRVELMVAGMVALTVVLAVIPAVGQPPLVAVAAIYFLTGLLFGTAMLGFSVIKERYPAAASGVATSKINTAGFVGGSFLPTILGVALDAYRTGETVGGAHVYTEFGYRVAFGILALTALISLVCSIWLLVRTRREEAAIARGEELGV